MEQNNLEIDTHTWSIALLQRCQGDLLRKKNLFKKLVLNISKRKNNKHQSLPHDIHKNKPEMNQKPKYKI